MPDSKENVQKQGSTPSMNLSRREMMKLGTMLGGAAVPMEDLDTSVATYVWLPIGFDKGQPYIRWKEEWSLDEFA